VLQLLHLCDSLFPVGAFAHSDGLETATASGVVRDADSLQLWVDAVLDEAFGRLDGPIAWRARVLIDDMRWDELARLDAEAIAMRPAASSRRATCSMGQRLLDTWRRLHPDPRLDRLHELASCGSIGPCFAVAFAAACGCADVPPASALEALAYTRLASTVSAAMRLAPVGQNDAHLVLSRTLARVPDIVATITERDVAHESFAPAMDIAAMSHQYLHSRLFRS
jgi:urease accessory protein